MMALKRTGLIFAAFLAALLAGMEAASADALRIVGLGDSLMAGFGLGANEAFPEKLEAALRMKGHDVAIVNAGVSGDTTADGLSRLDWSVPQGTQLVILELGANDMLRGLTPDITEKNLDAAIVGLRQRGISILLVGMVAAPNLGQVYADSFNSIYPRLAHKHGIALYPFFLDGVAGDRNFLLQDGMHPNATGVERMVDRMLPAVEEAIAAVTGAEQPSDNP